MALTRYSIPTKRQEEENIIMQKLTTNSADAIRTQHGNADLKEMVLQVYENSDMSALSETLLLGFPSIERVKIICSRNVDNRNRIDRRFWEAIGYALVNLQDLELANFSGDFPISSIALCLSQTDCRLERLLLHQIYFVSDDLEEDTAKLTEALRQHRHLKSFDLVGFFKSQQSEVSTGICSSFIDGISALPELEAVFVDSDRGLLDHGPFERLCQSTSLRKLHLRDVNFKNDGNILVARALEQNASLRELRLYNRQLQNREVTAWFQILRTHSSLEYFRLWTGYTTQTKNAELELARVLGNNTILKRCHFFHVNVGEEHVDRNGKAFAEMLENNTSLTNLTYSRCMTSLWWPKIKLYLELNTKGRRRLAEQFDTITRSEWMNVLVDSSDNVNHLFHFIRMNPLLCQASTQS